MKKNYVKKTICILISMSLILGGCGNTKKLTPDQPITTVQEQEDKQNIEQNMTEDETGQTTEQNNNEEAIKPRKLSVIKKYLAEYPEDESKLQTFPGYIVMHGEEKHGRQYLDQFLAAVKEKNNAQMVVVDYTVEGDAVLFYINYDGNDFYAVRDYSRDLFAGPGANKYQEVTYPYLNVVTGTQDNGDEYQYIILSNQESMTMEELEQQMLQSSPEGEANIFYVCTAVLGNQNAITTGEESWHDIATAYDETGVLINVDEIATIRVINGNTGDEKNFTKEDKEFGEICSHYQALDFEINQDMEGRIGYAYRMVLLDKDGNYLQNVTPYKDAVTIDGNIYDGSANGSTTELLLYLDLLW